MIKLKPDKSSSAKVSWIKALFLHVRTFCAGEVLFPWGTVRFYSLSNTSVINNPAACCSFVCVEGDRVFHRLSPSCSEQVIRALCTCVLAIFVTYSGWSSTLKDLSKITQTTVRHVLLVSFKHSSHRKSCFVCCQHVTCSRRQSARHQFGESRCFFFLKVWWL